MDDPDKFLKSEVDLDEEIKKCPGCREKEWRFVSYIFLYKGCRPIQHNPATPMLPRFTLVATHPELYAALLKLETLPLLAACQLMLQIGVLTFSCLFLLPRLVISIS